MSKTQQELQGIVDKIQDKLSGIDKAKLHEGVSDKDERIRKLEGEVQELTEKYKLLEAQWKKQQHDTVGAQETKNMGKQLLKG